MFINCCNILFVLAASVLPLLVNGQIQQSPCTSIQMQVETPTGNYQLITHDVITIYTPVNTTNLMRCQCIDGDEILRWIYPSRLSSYSCSNQGVGVCITNENDWQQLKIPLVNRRHEGLYNCYSHLSSVNVGFILSVFGPPVIEQPQHDSEFPLRSSNITLQCRGAGYGSLIYYWERKDSESEDWIIVDNTNMTSYTTRTSGQYRCNVTNDAGSVLSPVITIYDTMPVITTHPVNTTVKALTSVTFTCSVSNVNEVTYSWHRNNGDIPNNRSRGQNTNALTITRVIPPDEGVYYCIATNDAGSTSSRSASLTVGATSTVFTTHPQNQFIYNKENAGFECAANGSELLTISWIKNNNHISNSSQVVYGKRSVLKIDEATVDDTGIYQCIAINADNETILSKPAELLILPSINAHPDNVTVLTGQSVNLTCSSIGTDVVYQWIRNGVIISDDNSNVLRIIEIKQSDDSTYQCIASNKGGNATSNPAKITVYGNPTVDALPHQTIGVLDEQFQITCNATNDKNAPHNMMFTWMTPDGVDHNINMTSENDDHTASSTLYISRLARSDNGTYKCYVTNNNVSNASVVVTSTTVIVEEHPSQPLNFNVYYIDATSLLLIWNKPHNGKIDYYTVFYSDGEMTKSVNVFNFTGSYILENLMPSTQYSLNIIAVRLIGVNREVLEGDNSITVTATTSFRESEDNNCTCGMLMIRVLMVLLAVSLVSCLSLLIIALKLYKKNLQLHSKIKLTNKKILSTGTDEKLKFTDETMEFTDEILKSTNEMLTAPNPIYASAVTNKPIDQDSAIDNPMYQSRNKKNSLTCHEYETIFIDNIVAEHSAT